MSNDENKNTKSEDLFGMLKGMEGKFEFGDCTGAGGFGNCTIILTPAGSSKKHVLSFDMATSQVKAIVKSAV